jgi:hypothetical protein
MDVGCVLARNRPIKVLPRPMKPEKAPHEHFRFWFIRFRPSNFLFAAPKRVACAAFSEESRMKFVDPTQPYRKFGSRLFLKQAALRYAYPRRVEVKCSCCCHHVSNSTKARSHCKRCRSRLSRICLRSDSSSGSNKSKVIFAGWKSSARAWVM